GETVAEQETPAHPLAIDEFRDLLASAEPSLVQVGGAARRDVPQCIEGAPDRAGFGVAGGRQHVDVIVVGDQREAIGGPEKPQRLLYGLAGKGELARVGHRPRAIEDEGDVDRWALLLLRCTWRGDARQHITSARRAGADERAIGL